MYFKLKIYLNLGQVHFTYSRALCGWWLPYMTSFPLPTDRHISSAYQIWRQFNFSTSSPIISSNFSHVYKKKKSYFLNTYALYFLIFVGFFFPHKSASVHSTLLTSLLAKIYPLADENHKILFLLGSLST